jgi:hypothetical protein
LAIGLLAIVTAAISGGPAAAATSPAAPAWSIAASSYPTNFVPGTTASEGQPPGYLLVATNVGAAPTSAEFTVTDTLPAGIEFATSAGARAQYGVSQTPMPCEVSGRAVSCHGATPRLNPGEAVVFRVPVDVSAVAAPSVLDEAVVEGGGAPSTAVTTETAITTQLPPFGFLPGPGGISGAITAADGTEVTQAGSHPYQVRAATMFSSAARGPRNELFAIDAGVRDLTVGLPRGLTVDPRATAVRCTEVQLQSQPVGCPDASQVGTLTVSYSLGNAPVLTTVQLYNMVPPGGTPTELGAELIESLSIHMLGKIRSDGDYGFSGDIKDIPAKFYLLGAEVTLWGNPTDEAHDHLRGGCLNFGGVCTVEPSSAAFLTLPDACSEPLTTTARADSWIDPGSKIERSVDRTGMDGCNRLGFEPTFHAQPTTKVSDSPSGLDLSLHIPQQNDFAGLATADLRDTQIAFPAGMTVNPAGADGLAGCSPAQVGLVTAAGQSPVRFTADPANCPDSAKVGTVEIDTPLIAHSLPGAIYVAQPEENPFDSLLAVYVTVYDPSTGIVVKVAGEVEADPGSGRLTATFADNPELPIEEFRAHFFLGPRAILKTPALCGTYTTGAGLTPWSSPEGADARRSDAFVIATAASGGERCPTSESGAPNRPRFSAGSVAPAAGRYSPFLVHLSRDDGTQRLVAIDATLPAGLTGRLAGVPSCSEAELAALSCPAGSEVGTVDIAAGAGISPLHLAGHVYMAGPYRGAPLSLATVTPARAGPFDLGAVVVRVGLSVDPRSGQVHAVSDPLPTILKGIPLDIRSLSLKLDRPGFTLNPTSCDPMLVVGSAGSAAGQGVSLADPFQVGNCSRLGFRPAVSLRFFGPTHRGAHPGFRTVLTPRHGDANIRRVAVTLPGTELLDNRHIGAVCTMPQYVADQCPPASVYGYAKAWTPLLEQPLEGPVYLRTSNHRLPDLAASLNGQVHLDLIGRIDSVDGRLRNTFQGLPDAPLSKVVVTMRGGGRGLFVNSGHFCARRPRAGVAFLAQNGKTRKLDPLAKSTCGNRGEPEPETR